ncbi:50S ribosomal protein L18 [Candidatus Woesearchaeota archaeon]|nr:50S ribosomal protein L18 [Candidatus Woesearchaeota archaeon]MBW3006055.1 50S ribosomal protein L18 [Candidatus Woesearchaeota archaeon]
MSRFTVAKRRKREGKTDYKKRLNLLMSKKHRLIIRKSLKNLSLQVVEFAPAGDKVVLSVNSHDIQKLGWKANSNNLPAAYLCGYLLGTKALAKKIKDCILDLGMQSSVKKGVLFAALKGVVDAGLNVPHSENVFPEEKRIKGEHIADYAKSLKENKEKYEKQFAACLKQGFDPEKLPAHFDEIKAKIGAKK